MPLFSRVNAFPASEKAIITSGNTVFGVQLRSGQSLIPVPGVSLESLEYETEEAVRVPFEKIKRGRRVRRMVTVTPETPVAYTITMQLPVGRWLRSVLSKFMKPGVQCPFVGVIVNTCSDPCDRYALIFEDLTMSYKRIEQLVNGQEAGAGVPANSTLYGTEISVEFYVRQRRVNTADEALTTIAYWVNECDSCDNCCEDFIVGGGTVNESPTEDTAYLAVSHDRGQTLEEFTAIITQLDDNTVTDVIWEGNLVIVGYTGGIAWFTYEEGDDPATVTATLVTFAGAFPVRLARTPGADYGWIGVGAAGFIAYSRYGSDWTVLADATFSTATFTDVAWAETRKVGYLVGAMAGDLILELNGYTLENITADLDGDGFAGTNITAVHVADADDYVFIGDSTGQIWSNTDIDDGAVAWTQELFTGGAAVKDIDGNEFRLYAVAGNKFFDKSFVTDLDWKTIPAPSGVTLDTPARISVCTAQPEDYESQSHSAFVDADGNIITVSPCDDVCLTNI